MFYTYVLQSVNSGELCIGFTSDLKKRLKEHNLGLNFSTKRYMLGKLIYCETSVEMSDATRRERYLKTTQGGRLLKSRIKDCLRKDGRKI